MKATTVISSIDLLITLGKMCCCYIPLSGITFCTPSLGFSIEPQDTINGIDLANLEICFGVDLAFANCGLDLARKDEGCWGIGREVALWPAAKRLRVSASKRGLPGFGTLYAPPARLA